MYKLAAQKNGNLRRIYNNKTV